MDNKEKAIKSMRQRLTEYYAAYMQTLQAYSREDLIDRAVEIAATKAVYMKVQNGDFDDELLKTLAMHEKPLEALRDGWLGLQDKAMASAELTQVLKLIAADDSGAKLLGLPAGIDPTPTFGHKADDPVSVEEVFKKKLEANYEKVVNEWLRLEPTYLVERAAEIAATKQIYTELLNLPAEHQEYLSTLQYPLEMVYAEWSGGKDIDGQNMMTDDDIEETVDKMMEYHADYKHLFGMNNTHGQIMG